MSGRLTGTKRTRNEARGKTLKDSMCEICLKILTLKSVQRHTNAKSIQKSSSYILGFNNCEFAVTSNSTFEITGRCPRRSTRGPPYRVSVTIELSSGDITGDCTCPKYYYWCKHIAALAITFIRDSANFSFISLTVHQQREEEKIQEEIRRQNNISGYVYVVISRKDFVSDGWDEAYNPTHFETEILGIYDNEEAANERALEEVEELGGDEEDESIFNSDGLVYFSEMADTTQPLPHEVVVFVEKKPLMKDCL